MTDNKWSVYKHTSPSGKVYIGITSTLPRKRWARGLGYRNQVFYKAIEKYGWDNITHEIICQNVSEDCAVRLEKFLIAKYQSSDSRFGYNITGGGEVVHFTEDGKRRLIQGCKRANHERQWTDEARQKARERFTGKNNPSYGKPIPEHVRQAIIKANKSRVITEAMREKARLMGGWNKKKVFQFSLDGKFIKEFESLVEAERETGIKQGCIGDCASGRYKTAGKYIFSFNKELPKNYITELKSLYNNWHHVRPILMYDSNMILKKEYESISDAEKDGFNKRQVISCCQLERSDYKGYIFRYKDGNIIKKCTRPDAKRIIQYNKEMQIIHIYNNIKECEHDGYNRSGVYACINGQNKSYKNYIWKYAS